MFPFTPSRCGTLSNDTATTIGNSARSENLTRDDFPFASNHCYLNAAAQHPMSVDTLEAMQRHLHYQVYGQGEDRAYFGRAEKAELREEFAALIHATPEEIAFVQSTSDGENIVVSGLDLIGRGGNVVVDDLHFTSSLFLYKSLEEQGVELRVVKNRGGSIPLEEIDRAIDSETRLVSMALVSNINGYMHDVAAVSSLAHAKGAYLYADMIQAVGAVPLDMKAMGIDFAAASTYKWLMAERGFGLLYVDRALQDEVLPTTRWGHRQITNFDREAWSWDAYPGAAKYETGNIAEPLAAAVLASVRSIREMGVEHIVEHSQPLVLRLREELSAIGYEPMTPADTGTPIVAFSLTDPDKTIRQLKEAEVFVTVSPAERRMRVSVSVFNNDEGRRSIGQRSQLSGPEDHCRYW